jgi:hypothetical protein
MLYGMSTMASPKTTGARIIHSPRMSCMNSNPSERRARTLYVTVKFNEILVDSP